MTDLLASDRDALVGWLPDITEAERVELLSLATIEPVAAGTELLSVAQPVTRMGVVLSGIARRTERSGRTVLLEAGDWFGAEVLVGGSSRDALCTVSPTRVAWWSDFALDGLSQRRPGLAARLVGMALRRLAERLDREEERSRPFAPAWIEPNTLTRLVPAGEVVAATVDDEPVVAVSVAGRVVSLGDPIDPELDVRPIVVSDSAGAKVASATAALVLAEAARRMGAELDLELAGRAAPDAWVEVGFRLDASSAGVAAWTVADRADGPEPAVPAHRVPALHRAFLASFRALVTSSEPLVHELWDRTRLERAGRRRLVAAWETPFESLSHVPVLRCGGTRVVGEGPLLPSCRWFESCLPRGDDPGGAGLLAIRVPGERSSRWRLEFGPAPTLHDPTLHHPTLHEEPTKAPVVHEPRLTAEGILRLMK